MPHFGQVCQLVPQASRICVVGTKRDTIQADYCEADLIARAHPAEAAYYHGCAYFPVNCHDRSGVESICEHIVDTVTGMTLHKKRTISESIISILMQLADNVLDCVAAFFSLPVPKDVNQDTPDAEELDDAVVSRLTHSPIAKAWGNWVKERVDAPWGVPTHQITPNLIAKDNTPHERSAVDFVRRHTRIPVPQVRHRHLKYWMVSEFINGNMLYACWEAQSTFMQFRIACTVRNYLAQLRRLRGAIPGRLETHIASGLLLECNEKGPFTSLVRFQTWCELVAVTGWCSQATALRHIGQTDKIEPRQAPTCREPWDLVYAHGDLNLTNLLLGSDGVLWVVDWAESGFYPQWWDGVAMASFPDAPRSWRPWRPFMAGRHADRMHKSFWAFFTQEVHRF